MGQACSGSGSKTTEKNKEKTDKNNKSSEPRPVQLATRPLAVKASKQAAAAALNTANNHNNPNENLSNGTLVPTKQSSGVLSVGQLMVQLTGGGRKTSSQQQQQHRPHHDEITYNVEVCLSAYYLLLTHATSILHPLTNDHVVSYIPLVHHIWL